MEKVRRYKKKTRRKKTWLQTFIFLSVITALFLVTMLLWQFYQTFQEVYQPDETDQAGGGSSFPSGSASAQEKKQDEPVSVLIMGLDNRPQTGSLNTDVLMVAVINPETKKVHMMSVPRDTMINIPGYSGDYKANAVYAYGEMARRQAERRGETPQITGISLAKKTFADLLGIPVDYYVQLDFQGFVKVIDQLDGIDVYVDQTMIYDDPSDNTHIFLKQGQQTLSGKQALDFVRHRLDNRGPEYYSSDFDRNRRQREVVKSVADKFFTLKGFTQFFDLMDIAGEHVKTDMPASTIKDLAVEFRQFQSDDIVTLDNEAYWDSSLGFTIIPQERMVEIQRIFQREMGLIE